MTADLDRRLRAANPVADDELSTWASSPAAIRAQLRASTEHVAVGDNARPVRRPTARAVVALSASLAAVAAMVALWAPLRDSPGSRDVDIVDAASGSAGAAPAGQEEIDVPSRPPQSRLGAPPRPLGLESLPPLPEEEWNALANSVQTVAGAHPDVVLGVYAEGNLLVVRTALGEQESGQQLFSSLGTGRIVVSECAWTAEDAEQTRQRATEALRGAATAFSVTFDPRACKVAVLASGLEESEIVRLRADLGDAVSVSPVETMERYGTAGR